MSAAALGLVALVGSMQLGWAGAVANQEAHGVGQLEPVIEIAVANSTEPEPSHADNLKASVEHMLRGN